MKDTQRGSAKEKVVIIWLVPVKIKGNSPVKLFETININKPKKSRVLPRIDWVPRRILISE